MRVGRPREFDPDTCLDVAMLEFWQHGYDATGIGDLAKAMGIGRQSLYNTFGDKRQIFLAAVRRYGEQREHQCREIFNDMPTVLEGVCALIRQVGSEEGGCGCMVTNSATRFATNDPEMAEVLRGEMDRPVRVFAELFAQARQRGELAPEVDVDALAGNISILISGLGVRTMLGCDPAGTEEVVRMAKVMFAVSANASRSAETASFPAR